MWPPFRFARYASPTGTICATCIVTFVDRCSTTGRIAYARDVDDPEAPPLKYCDRHIGKREPEPAPRGLRFFAPLDVIGLLWPVWTVPLAVVVATPIIGAVDSWSEARQGDIAILFYGGIYAVYLMVPCAIAYLLARGASLLFGSWAILACGSAGIILSVLLAVTGVLWWSSILIAAPSLSAMISSGIRTQIEPASATL